MDSSVIDLLNDSYPKERSVAFYPINYSLPPNIFQRYAKIFGEKMLLKNPNKTIKEICNELNFGSLSFFGKYVKRLFGVSPKEYRDNLNLKSQQGELTL